MKKSVYGNLLNVKYLDVSLLSITRCQYIQWRFNVNECRKHLNKGNLKVTQPNGIKGAKNY